MNDLAADALEVSGVLHRTVSVYQMMRGPGGYVVLIAAVYFGMLAVAGVGAAVQVRRERRSARDGPPQAGPET